MSNIISIDIDENFPIAGQDNDSQGFRDNFNIIKNSLATAKSEITNLEENSAKLNLDNDFNNNEIQQAILFNTTEKTISQATATSISINWSYGQHQTVIATGDLTLTLANWPISGRYAKLRVEVYGNDSGVHNLSWASTQGNNIKAVAGFPTAFTIESSTNPKIFDFWTSDGGSTVFAQYLGEFV